MEIIQKEGKIISQMTIQEIKYLSSLHGPGLIYGINNPNLQLSDEDLIRLENKTIEELQKTGIIKQQGNKLLVDEFINAMVYSCINSDHLLVIKDKKVNKESYIHFLRDWQLLIEPVKGECNLIAFENRNYLWEYIKEHHFEYQEKDQKNLEIIVSDKDLEISTYLMDSEQPENAVNHFMEKSITDQVISKEFLKELLNPVEDLEFNLIYNHKDPNLAYQFWFKIFVYMNFYIFITKNFSIQNYEEYLNLKLISFDSLEKKFLGILPKY